MDEKKLLFILGCVKDSIEVVGVHLSDYLIWKQRQRIKEAALVLIVVMICCIITVLLLLH